AEKPGVDSSILSLGTIFLNDFSLRCFFVLNEGRIDQEGRILGPSSVSVLDADTGRLLRTEVISLGPQALAVDEAAGRVIVTTQGRLDGRPRGPGRASLLPSIDLGR